MESHRDCAESLAVIMSDRYGEEVGFNRDGVVWLHDLVQTRDEEIDPETRVGLIDLMGSFLGEAIRSEYGGVWESEEGRSGIRIGEAESVNPFWIVDLCLRYRSVYAVTRLFEVVRAIAKVRIGGLYAVLDEAGTYGISKVLAADHLGVHIRRYANRLQMRPRNLDAETLELGLDVEAWETRGSIPSELPIGHLPLTHESFWELNPTLVQIDLVEEGELDGYHLWLAGDAK